MHKRSDALVLPFERPQQFKIFYLIKKILNYTQFLFIMAEIDIESVIKRYRCPICKSTHKIKLNKNIKEGRTKFPFPYVILHDFINEGELKELITILYIDQSLQIRHVEIQEIVDDSLFSKSQIVAMTKTLFEENERLMEDVARLTDQLNKLKKK